MYTANAVILTCLQRQRADIVQRFMNSLDKEHEYQFSPDLFLLCKYSLGIPLTAYEIMRMAKAFEFSKDNYIKKYPDAFLQALSSNINEKYKADSISWNHILTNTDFNRLSSEELPVFANISIREKSIKVPSLLASFKLKKSIYDLLDKTHEDVKQQLAAMRKSGETLPEAKNTPSNKKPKEVLTFDAPQEQALQAAYNTAKNNSLEQHFASIALQDFYYRYRSLDQVYVEKCIAFCKDDIARLPEIQRSYVDEERKRILSKGWLSKSEAQQEISEIKPFYANIPAFKRLAIIYEKAKDYDSAINICDQAISFYSAGNITSEVSDFSDRKQKLYNKRKKV